MTIALYAHVGYLASHDSTGVALSWGLNRPGWKARGESMFAHNWTWEFPWWARPQAVRQRMWMASLRRKQRRAERRNG